MKNMNYSGNMTTCHITIVDSNGVSGTIHNTHPNFEQARSLVRSGKYDEFMKMANPIDVVRECVSDRVSVKNDVVMFDGKIINNLMSQRMLDLIHDGFSIAPLVNFMINLNENPSKRAVDELYGFLEASELTITKDGYFVAYKKVTDDYLDVYSKSIDNHPGCVVQMSRCKVDDDRDRTCSAGLHFCGRYYLSAYGGARTIVVKINPRDVVSIPSDYHNHKGRTCKYIVIGEVESGCDINGKRKEAKLEGSLFTGVGVKIATPTVDDYHVHNFYPTRTSARNAARGATAYRFKDFGQAAPHGERWATVMINT